MTGLQPGIRVVAAPHFHHARSWADQLQINSGVLVEGDCIVAHDDWRQPSPDELTLLTAPAGEPAEAIALFNIPERLRALWWESAADQSAGSEAGRKAFEGFAAQVLEFLQFKRLPLPPACAFEVVLQAPGQATTRPQAGGQAVQRLRAAINLSDEASALVFLNLGGTYLSNCLPRPPASDSLHDRARAFLSAFPNYPLIKLVLGPGEGIWVATCEVVIDGDTRGRNEVDVQLVLRAG